MNSMRARAHTHMNKSSLVGNKVDGRAHTHGENVSETRIDGMVAVDEIS